MKKNKQKEFILHDGYEIYENDYYNPAYSSTKYEYQNTLDCDELMGNGESIEDCMKQIDEQLYRSIYINVHVK